MADDLVPSTPFVYHVGLVTACVGIACFLFLFVLAYRLPRLREHPESMVLYIALCGIMYNGRGAWRSGAWEQLHGTEVIHENHSWLTIADSCLSETLWAHVSSSERGEWPLGDCDAPSRPPPPVLAHRLPHLELPVGV